jgi:hypothetical protein
MVMAARDRNGRREGPDMFEILLTVLGIAASALYVGYLAFAIRAVPLWIIVILTFVLMIRQFAVELRNGARRGPRDDAR